MQAPAARHARALSTLYGHLLGGATALLPPFSGTTRPVDTGYRWTPADVTPGVRASIRDADGHPTNCDGKSWMAHIAAQAALGGMRPYGWLTPEEAPALVPLPKPLSQCKIGLVSTSGAYVTGQKAYFYKEDSSMRAVPTDTPSEALRFSHLTENYLVDGRRDPACIFPLATLRRAVAQCVVGSLAANAFSVMGANYSMRTLRETLCPAVVRLGFGRIVALCHHLSTSYHCSNTRFPKKFGASASEATMRPNLGAARGRRGPRRCSGRADVTPLPPDGEPGGP